ncbi:MAG: hypothetical protein JW814_09600 [Candidatus Krumholzibacteriota bacterium]|nr:hypothetical protein [Candidatus Krumholzibacteriota bacterium]
MLDKDSISELLSHRTSDDEIYHDLMQFKISEILLVATIYDAFILEQEGKLTELIFSEYNQLNLSSAPRVTSVSFGEKALNILEKRQFDMVILTMRIDEMTPFELSEKIREKNSDIPILLLLNDDNDLQLIKDRKDRLRYFDRVFIWKGDAKVFLAMTKYIEDKINVVNDTDVGLVRVILLVEDSIHYYSRYLPILHVEIMKQTRLLIADEHLNEIKKLLRMRTRPKVLLAETYEEAISIIEKYREYLICVISDVRFSRDGVMNDTAGIDLIRHVREANQSLPVLLQSSDPSNAKVAEELDISFLDKNSDNLQRDLTEFILGELGFGDFTFRDHTGKVITRVETMAEFKELLKSVPDESLYFHASRNHFSSWLMARGEIQIAKFIQPIKVSDFDSISELRKHLLDICDIVHDQKTRGQVINFDESLLGQSTYIVRLSGGSVGGKGRGMVFLNMLIQNRELFSINPDLNILIPQTNIIGTEEYDFFMENNGLMEKFEREEDYDSIKKMALEGSLSSELHEKLERFLARVDCPISVRSSSLFEDSISQPFSGVYETYFLPNNDPDPAARLRQLEEAIKLVYASVYSPSARAYFDAIEYRIGEEKMGVLLQRLVGKGYDGRFYPQISGVAQSYNYYPVSYLKPTDGIAIAGFGLGKYVVDGERAWRFCPRYPKIDFIAQEDFVKESQVEFYALDLENNGANLAEGSDSTLLRLEISDAEKDGSLDYCASTWDFQDNIVRTGSGYVGPRIMNFASILKYNYIPLAETLDALLGVIKSSMGIPIEIEFAVDLDETLNGKPSLYILQVRPLLRNFEDFHLGLEDIKSDSILLYTDKAMGNGVIDGLEDIIFVDQARFDRSRTVEMTEELETLNHRLKSEKRKYILIGPGRWGSRDRWLGIPVRWSQISGARIIVETEMEDFHVDSSLGSHFFHNVTSNNIGYFFVPHGSNRNYIDWKWLESQKVMEKTKHFIHVRLDDPVTAKMDGRSGVSVLCR